MTLRVCIDCMATIPAGRSRCRTCERTKDRARGTTTQRGYGADHEAVARDYQQLMDHGQRFTCWRCGREVGTQRGSDWHLGHCDNDRGTYHGPEHPACNLATSGRTASCPHVSHMWVGDIRKAGESGPAGDPRPAGEAKVKAEKSEAKPAKKAAKKS